MKYRTTSELENEIGRLDDLLNGMCLDFDGLITLLKEKVDSVNQQIGEIHRNPDQLTDLNDKVYELTETVNDINKLLTLCHRLVSIDL